MVISQLLAQLVSLNIKIETDGEKLLVQAPKGAVTKALQASIREHKDELVAFLNKNNEKFPEAVPDALNRHEPFPLNPIQQAYWFGRNSAADYGNVACHYYVEHDIENLDVARLTAAWQKVVAGNDMLRAIIRDDGLQQILDSVPPYEIPVVDVSEMDAAAREQCILQARDRLSHQVLPTDQWPLFEILLHRLPGDKYRFHFSFDLLVADVMSLFSFITQWYQHYNNPDLPVAQHELSFRDYIITQQDFYQHSLYKRSLEYWRKRIPSLPMAPELPINASSERKEKSKFVRIEQRLKKSDLEALKAISQKYNATVSMTMCTVFAEVISRWSKSKHFTLNMTLFNRLPIHPQVNDIIGDFTSLNLLEVDFREEKPFSARVDQLTKQFWKDLEHRYVHGVDVMRELSQYHGSTLLMPIIFTSTIGSHDISQSFVTFEQWFGKAEYSITQTPQLWLDFQILEEGDELAFNWDVVDGLFDAAMLDDMFACYTETLQRIAQDDALWQAPLQLALPSHQQQARANYNATEENYDAALMHSMFHTVAQAQPEKLALHYDGVSLTYGELFAQSNQLARKLIGLNARPNSLIAVVMERGWEQVLATVAVLNAGAAYLPIDPKWPIERISHLLDIGDVEIVLTQSEVDELIQWPDTLQVLCVDEHPAQNEDSSYIAPIQSADDIAYVIFTSGSTGTPKGVVIDHAGAVNTLQSINRNFAITADDCIFGISALHFDLSVFDIFGTLAAGASLVIPKEDALKDPSHWHELMRAHQVTVWNSVPALMNMLVEYVESIGDRLAPQLRLVMMSGDWIPVGLPIRIKQLGQEGIAVMSLGGATEASIWSIHFPIESVDPSWKSIPYGYPLPNQQCHVLDDNLAPCPDHVAGDFYISGIGLAKGYWRDSEKTANSFIRHPKTGERLYRTGDMARFHPEGYVEFLGREDGQVKVQGYRIELGEIETQLNREESVKDSIVTLGKDAGGNNRLIAYVVNDAACAEAKSEQKNLAEAIRRARFKFEQRGVRKFDLDVHSTPLADTRENPLLIDVDLLLSASGKDAVALHDIAAMLAPLRQARIGCGPLPKYVYPSAGSLYPVQCYLTVGENLSGLEAGNYYYDPAQHRLVALGSTRTGNVEQAISLYLVADYAAIEPLYGELSQRLCELEAGYIGALLQHASSAQGLVLQPHTHDALHDYAAQFSLSKSHSVLACFQLGNAGQQAEFSPRPMSAMLSHTAIVKTSDTIALEESTPKLPKILSYVRRQSYRRFAGGKATLNDVSVLLKALTEAPLHTLSTQGAAQQAASIDVYLYVKPGAVKGLRAGVYYFSANQAQLSFIASVDLNSAFEGANEALYKAAAFGIFFVAERTSMAEKEAEARLNFTVGQAGQLLSSVAPEHNIGLCAIGGFQHEALLNGIGLLAGDYSVCHSLLGGKISPAQSQTWAPLDETQTQLSAAEQLQESLKHVLPDYMVPSKFIFIDQIPLSANGKVDRSALPDPDIEQLDIVVAPQNETEAQLIALWKSILDKETIGIHHNFFELGGSSMLVMKVQQKLREMLGTNLPIVELFKHPTIHELANYLDEHSLSLRSDMHQHAQPEFE